MSSNKKSRARRSWNEKLNDSKDLPRVIQIPPESELRWGRGSMVIPAPMEVDEAIRGVARGKVVTINGLRSLLAARHGTDTACPITTGIFTWIAANASEERTPGGTSRGATPWWRVLKEGGRLNPKLPGGVEEQARRLRAEGFEVSPTPRGAALVVVGYKDKLATAA